MNATQTEEDRSLEPVVPSVVLVLSLLEMLLFELVLGIYDYSIGVCSLYYNGFFSNKINKSEQRCA